jgi:hypothetical protein
VYRQWARDRAEVRIQLVDRSEITGRLSAAYADHIEVITFERGAYAIAFTAIDLAIRGTD